MTHWKLQLKKLALPLSLRKEIEYGETIPKWYGLAFVEYMRMRAVCYPIPLNLIVAFWMMMQRMTKYQISAILNKFYEESNS